MERRESVTTTESRGKSESRRRNQDMNKVMYENIKGRPPQQIAKSKEKMNKNGSLDGREK